jgi:hypothetical protein
MISDMRLGGIYRESEGERESSNEDAYIGVKIC